MIYPISYTDEVQSITVESEQKLGLTDALLVTAAAAVQGLHGLAPTSEIDFRELPAQPGVYRLRWTLKDTRQWTQKIDIAVMPDFTVETSYSAGSKFKVSEMDAFRIVRGTIMNLFTNKALKKVNWTFV